MVVYFMQTLSGWGRWQMIFMQVTLLAKFQKISIPPQRRSPTPLEISFHFCGGEYGYFLAEFRLHNDKLETRQNKGSSQFATMHESFEENMWFYLAKVLFSCSEPIQNIFKQ